MATTAGKSRRNRLPSARISDNNNGEAPSAIHQQALATKPILNFIKKMKKLLAQLPDTIPEASEADDIVRVITTVHGIDESVCGTFNRRFDILFGADCRTPDGRLKNIRRGDFGMGCAIDYLESIHWESADIPLDLAEVKLTRIVHELEYLCSTKPAITHEENANQPGTSTAVTSLEQENQPPGSQTTHVAGKPFKGPNFEREMDRIFNVTTSVKNKRDDKTYKPRKNPQLSEESEDDFDMDELDQPIAPPTHKHKIVVIESEDENTDAAPASKGSEATVRAKNGSKVRHPFQGICRFKLV
ncbi:hypothetical protein B0H14DRAFT_3863890 [Mycena olivaceomarginata]|nr:hypothetical protein B0H14DRAFT_3863890 [Mycena olivaceomarginata]